MTQSGAIKGASVEIGSCSELFIMQIPKGKSWQAVSAKAPTHTGRIMPCSSRCRKSISLAAQRFNSRLEVERRFGILVSRAALFGWLTSVDGLFCASLRFVAAVVAVAKNVLPRTALVTRPSCNSNGRLQPICEQRDSHFRSLKG
jgi:hypothetical protein